VKATWKLSSMCFHTWGYITNARVVFDPTCPSVVMGTFTKTDWKSMYGDLKEMIKEVDLRLYVDYYRDGEQFTRRSRTMFVIYLNMAPIVWFSKPQPTVESSFFGD
jgi:hypothetical protein